MPQSLQAFLAMMLATMAALSQFRAQVTTYEDMVRGEYEIMANAVAIEQIELIDLNTAWANLESVDGDTLAVTWAVGTESVAFSLAFAVQYVDESGVPSGIPTTVKEVSVTATNTKFSSALVTHTRLFTQ